MRAPVGADAQTAQELVFQERTLAFDAAEDARLIGLCGLDSPVFQGVVDPASIVEIVAREGLRNGVSVAGAVALGQRYIQRAPIRHGEALTLRGRLAAAESNDRGDVEESRLRFSDAHGELRVTAVNRMLRRRTRPDAVRADTPRPVAVAETVGLRVVGAARFEPEAVASYFKGTPNPLHADPEAARAAGLRAPIVGGGMAARFLTHRLWRLHQPLAVDMTLSFRRPVFWDDTCQIMAATHDGLCTRLCLARDGKILVALEIESLTPRRRAPVEFLDAGDIS
jgi:acyl dehydratase